MKKKYFDMKRKRLKGIFVPEKRNMSLHRKQSKTWKQKHFTESHK